MSVECQAVTRSERREMCEGAVGLVPASCPWPARLSSVLQYLGNLLIHTVPPQGLFLNLCLYLFFSVSDFIIILRGDFILLVVFILNRPYYSLPIGNSTGSREHYYKEVIISIRVCVCVYLDIRQAENPRKFTASFSFYLHVHRCVDSGQSPNIFSAISHEGIPP